MKGHAIYTFDHVVGFGAPDIGGAKIEHVRAFVHFFLAHLRERVVIVLCQKISEFFRPVGIGFLSNDERLLAPMGEWHLDIKAGGGRDGYHPVSLYRGQIPYGFNDFGQMRGSCSAAATDDVHAKAGDKILKMSGQLLGCQFIDRMSAHILGEVPRSAERR